MPIVHKALVALLWLMPGGLLLGPALLLYQRRRQAKALLAADARQHTA